MAGSVSFVAASAGNTGAGTSNSYVTSYPAGTADLDVLVLTVHVSGSSLAPTTPTDWLPLPGITFPVAQSTASRLWAYYRVKQPGDSAPTVTISGASTGGWVMDAWRAGDTATPIGAADVSTGSGTSIVLPTLAGVLAGSGLAARVHARVASGTIPSGIDPDGLYAESVDQATNRNTANANIRIEGASRLISAAGSYGGETFLVANAISSSLIALLVEIRAQVLQTGRATVGLGGHGTATRVATTTGRAGLGIGGHGQAAHAAAGRTSLGLAGAGSVGKLASVDGRAVLGLGGYGTPTAPGVVSTSGRASVGLSGHATVSRVAVVGGVASLGVTGRAVATRPSTRGSMHHASRAVATMAAASGAGPTMTGA